MRIGIVWTINAAERTVTVRWPDTGIVSGPLHVLRTDSAWLPLIGEPVLVGHLVARDGDGIVLGVVQ